MRQISEPESTRSLPNRHLNLGHENFALEAPVDFGRSGRFEEQRERFDEVSSRFFNRGTLAGNIKLGTEGYKAVIFTFYDGRYPLRWLHKPSLHQLSSDAGRSLSRLGIRRVVRPGGRPSVCAAAAALGSENGDLKRDDRSLKSTGTANPIRSQRMIAHYWD